MLLMLKQKIRIGHLIKAVLLAVVLSLGIFSSGLVGADQYDEQIRVLQEQNATNQLQQQIDEQQAELARQKQVLGKNIKTMYLEGEISTLEILAASKDLSEFVDRQQYRNSVQSKIKTTVEKITQLKLELEQKQRQIQVLIKEQEAQQGQLSANYSQQNDMLNY